MTLVNVREYTGRWAQQHGGVSPSGMVRVWVRVMRVLAEPLAAHRVPPWVLTVLAVLTAGCAPAVTGWGEPRFAGMLVLVAGLFDGLDGAVALLSNRTSRLGAVLDDVGDRVADLFAVLALWIAGAPAGVCVAAAAVGLLFEYLREALRARGFRQVGTVTVAERPTRVIVVAMFLIGAVPTAGAWVLLVVCALGPLQLAWGLRAKRSGRAHQPGHNRGGQPHQG